MIHVAQRCPPGAASESLLRTDASTSCCVKSDKAPHPGPKSRGKAVRYDERRYKRRNCIEIIFGRLKDWLRIATRYDRCAKTFLSAVALAATVLFWL